MPKGTKQPPVVILVDPAHDGNIGSTARAMCNFGLKDLRLVRPKENWLTLFTRQMASGANEILHNVKIFESTQDAVSDINRLYASTARPRDMIKPVVTPNQAAIEMCQASDDGEKVGILFGTEVSGLVNEDVVLADSIIQINLSPDFPSLNLAQAVLLISYEWFQKATTTLRPDRFLRRGKTPPATQEDLMGFYGHLEGELDKSYFWRTPDKRPDMIRSIRNIFGRSQLTHQEIQTLRGIITALVHHRWREKN